MAPEIKPDEAPEKHHLTSGLKSIDFEPVGRWFEACMRRQRHGKSMSFSSDTADDTTEEEDGSSTALTRDDKVFILSLNVKDYKKQDHYRVLEIKARFTASDDDIKKAYRKMVLRHHPDKKSHNKNAFVLPGLNEHEYFTCITKAYETLSNTTSRRAYDSVDPEIDDATPTSVKGNFFDTFTPAFERNSRWSSKRPVPLLGNLSSTKEEVDDFYTFWYNFESWREFSYNDEEDKDSAESREERRWMEKQNRRKRQSKKKEELARIRLLVDSAYGNDPRLKMFVDEKKQKKLMERKAKEEAVKEKERLRLEAEVAERKAKELIEQEAKEKAVKEKKEREKLKKMTTKEKKTVRQIIKEHNYFADQNMDLVEELEKLEKMLENLTLESLQELRMIAERKAIDELKAAYLKNVTSVQGQLKKAEQEKQKEEKAQTTTTPTQPPASVLTPANKPWPEDEMQLLVKATTLFPPGTASRWQVIANYVNEHASQSSNRTAKQVISTVKALQKLDPTVKDEVNKRAFEKLSKETSSKISSAKPTGGVTVRDEGQATADKTWSSEEQKLLEQSLKTFPASTPERWERISEAVSTRTKKECIKRYKELVEMVKAKKSAQALVAQTAAQKAAK